MGSAVAFELAHRLRQAMDPGPLVLFASGADAPSRRDSERYAKLTSDRDLMDELARLDGTPDAALSSSELMAFALPILRADFQACGTYRCPAERRIDSPIVVFGGTRDNTTAETLAAWNEHTTAEATLDMFDGGHFFIREHEAELLGVIVAEISRRIEQGEGSGRARARPQASSNAPLGRANGERKC
jgi:surfactin synthase thioesterase subunit